MVEKSMEKKEAILKTLGNCSDIGDNAGVHYDGLKILAKDFNTNSNIKRFLTILNALGNPDRFLILHLLRVKDRCVCELEAAIDKSQPAISRHLKILESAELIRGWKHGKFTHYSLVQQNFEFFREYSHEWIAEISNWFGLI